MNYNNEISKRTSKYVVSPRKVCLMDYIDYEFANHASYHNYMGIHVYYCTYVCCTCAINWKLTVYYQQRIELPKVVWVLHALSQPR